MKIRWTKAASDDLDSIEDYIWQDNPKAAVRQVLQILKTVERKSVRNAGDGASGQAAEYSRVCD